MMLLRIKGIKQEFEAIPGEIYNLSIESPSFLYTCIRAFYSEDEDIIKVLKDYKEIPLSKNVLFIKDLFDLDPNSKKILTIIYKQAQTNYMNDERKNMLAHIQEEICELLDDISMDFNYPMVFDRIVGIDKIMTNSSFCFNYEQQKNFRDSFLSYLKIIQEISKAKFIVTTNLNSLLLESEIEEIKKELSLLDLTLLNISFFHQPIKNTSIIDSDWCEF